MPAGFKVSKNVTLPLSKWKNDAPKFLKLEAPIFLGKQIDDSKKNANGETQQPAHLINCVDLETGEQIQVIVAKVLHSTLDEEYPENGYVGKAFAITQHRDPGKKYNTFSVQELEYEQPQTAPAETKPAKAPKA
jgi:hypothetical protein